MMVECLEGKFHDCSLFCFLPLAHVYCRQDITYFTEPLLSLAILSARPFIILMAISKFASSLYARKYVTYGFESASVLGMMRDGPVGFFILRLGIFSLASRERKQAHMISLIKT